jgi:long-chain acyl-CoA synthetase
VSPAPGLGDGNLALLLSVAARQWPRRIVVRHAGRGVSFAAVERRSVQAAALLRERGVRRGDRVALQLPNVPAFLDLYFGILRIGAVVVPVNPLLKGRETAYALEDSDTRLLFAWHESDAPSASSGPAELITVGEDAEGDPLAHLEPDHSVVDVDPEETAVILYTSGTTGRPKGAELTHRNLGLNTRAVIETFSLSAADVFLGALPLYHSFGQTCVLNAAISVGARVALLTRFDGAAAAELIEDEAVTVAMAVPTMFAALTAVASDPGAFATLRLCVSGGAPLPREQREEFSRATGAEILESYGLSETSPAATLNQPQGARRVGSVGQPIAGVEIKIVAEDGEEVPTGATGQIAIRGHNVMKGYWRRDRATDEAITADGWFLTGDLGRLDEDGFLFVIGRLKDVIIRGGLNVYPREIEEVMHRHPDVVEAAVIGVPNAQLGEEVAAAVVFRAGAVAGPEELRAWVRERVAPYKYPRQVWSVGELPKGPTGKILKREIAIPKESEA